jgi:hypothetical protein
VVTIFRVTRRDWVWFANVRTSASGAFRLAWRARRQRPLRLVAMTRIARTAIRSPVVRIGRRG